MTVRQNANLKCALKKIMVSKCLFPVTGKMGGMGGGRTGRNFWVYGAEMTIKGGREGRA